MPEQNDEILLKKNIFKCILLNKNYHCSLSKILLKFVPGIPTGNMSQGVQPWALTKFPDFSLTILWFSLTMRHIIGISLLP